MTDIQLTRNVLRRQAAPLRQEVTDALRELIVMNEYSPGQRLTESELCDRFAVSRTVVREALRQLEAERLVTMVANRGPEVATLEEADARSLYEIREAIESLAGSLFAQRASAADKAALQAATEKMEAAVASGNLFEIRDAKDQFYDALVSGSGNTEIAQVLRTIHARTELLRVVSLHSPHRLPEMMAEIRKITHAAVAGDAVGAREACQAHVRNAAAAGLAQLRAADGR